MNSRARLGSYFKKNRMSSDSFLLCGRDLVGGEFCCFFQSRLSSRVAGFLTSLGDATYLFDWRLSFGSDYEESPALAQIGLLIDNTRHQTWDRQKVTVTVADDIPTQWIFNPLSWSPDLSPCFWLWALFGLQPFLVLLRLSLPLSKCQPLLRCKLLKLLPLPRSYNREFKATWTKSHPLVWNLPLCPSVWRNAPHHLPRRRLLQSNVISTFGSGVVVSWPHSLLPFTTLDPSSGRNKMLTSYDSCAAPFWIFFSRQQYLRFHLFANWDGICISLLFAVNRRKLPTYCWLFEGVFCVCVMRAFAGVAAWSCCVSLIWFDSRKLDLIRGQLQILEPDGFCSCSKLCMKNIC